LYLYRYVQDIEDYIFVTILTPSLNLNPTKSPKEQKKKKKVKEAGQRKEMK
jgi:hypothetical protein